MRSTHRMRRGLTGALALAGLLMPAAALQAEILYNPQGWRFPNIISAAKEAIQVTDRTSVIAGKETVNKGYRRTNGTRVMTYEIEGKVFGVDIDEDGKPPFEFGIMDADGDGKFESKILYVKGNKDHFYVPQWIIDYYYSLHPEAARGPGSSPVMPSLGQPAQAGKKSATPPPAPKKKPGFPKTSDLATP